MRNQNCVQGVWEKDEVRKDDSFNTFEVSTSTVKFKRLRNAINSVRVTRPRLKHDNGESVRLPAVW